MVLQILLILALIIQVVAAIVSMTLTRRTKFNFTWFLFSAAILLISYQLVIEIIAIFQTKPSSYKAFSLWSTIVLSLCVAFGLFYVSKIINYIESINKQKRLTQERLLTTIIYTEEKERQRLSKDLHDGLGPLLSSAKMSISVLAKLETDPRMLEIINNTSYVINEAIKEVKDISNNISPTILQNFGLSRALNNFISKLTLNNTMKIEFFSSDKEARFNGNIEVVFYRVGCELINNAIKHSEASKISVNLESWKKTLILIVEDNGIGINDDARASITKESSGMGLKNIISRVNSLNGNIDFKKQEKGTKVTITVKI